MTYIFANWKMYLTHKEGLALARKLQTVSIPDDVTLGVFPNMITTAAVKELLEDTAIQVGAQNLAWTPAGAYTGAVSAFIAKEIGLSYALVGHSERRYIFAETNTVVRKKIEACFDSGITPVVCIGETTKDLEEGNREYRIKKQIMKALEGLSVKDNQLIIAYEPVWAIGTGKQCAPQDVIEMHTLIRKEIKSYTDAEVPLLYGGSVDAQNVVSYIKLDCVDGVLVGGASTHYDSLISLLGAVQESR
ncbi:triose-phosphate isomerase [Patescibacteria group bacterium]|nr:triose-phosphate isomerase [Patescibacteria group bacterium]MBU1721447.1 triose-phosphate isomerase [Patescibacteria group bacterium]MBU1901301.1 triose-phosphate isomerase [Patescibacteria group bacterium]